MRCLGKQKDTRQGEIFILEVSFRGLNLENGLREKIEAVTLSLKKSKIFSNLKNYGNNLHFTYNCLKDERHLSAAFGVAVRC